MLGVRLRAAPAVLIPPGIGPRDSAQTRLLDSELHKQPRAAAKEKYLKPLIIDFENPVRYPALLLAPRKLYNVVKNTQEKKSHQEINLLNVQHRRAGKGFHGEVSTCGGRNLFL
ncbi:unnamed protein product [Coccothraustes coccothraustes]